MNKYYLAICVLFVFGSQLTPSENQTYLAMADASLDQEVMDAMNQEAEAQ